MTAVTLYSRQNELARYLLYLQASAKKSAAVLASILQNTDYKGI
jgi:hypothetical protein